MKGQRDPYVVEVDVSIYSRSGAQRKKPKKFFLTQTGHVLLCSLVACIRRAVLEIVSIYVLVNIRYNVKRSSHCIYRQRSGMYVLMEMVNAYTRYRAA